MGTGQMMLTVGAMLLLAMTILTVNRGFLTTDSSMIQNRYDIMSVSLATSIIEAAVTLPFDNKTDGAAITSPTSLTAVSSLGIESGESRNLPGEFNDFDDYNCYKTIPKVDTVSYTGTNRTAIFNTLIRVDYVNAANPSVVSTIPTYHKRIIVKVYSPGLQDTISMSTVYSYWYFR